jgi:hypothetical protein
MITEACKQIRSKYKASCPVSAGGLLRTFCSKSPRLAVRVVHIRLLLLKGTLLPLATQDTDFSLVMLCSVYLLCTGTGRRPGWWKS